MLDRPFDTIDEATLSALSENQVAEARNLEFKRDLPGGNDQQVKEFLADVTSLANAQGGDLIFGIEDENGVACGLPGLAIPDPDAEILRLESRLQDSVAPRLTGVRSRWVPLEAGGGVIIMRIPASLASPHRLTFKNSGRFYNRNSRGKYEMDVHELRHAFTQSQQLPQRFRQLHADAIRRARGIEMPFAIDPFPTAVVSVAPLGLFREERNIPIDRDHALLPPSRGGFHSVEMIEGVLMHAPVNAETGKAGAFSLTYRSGRTDSAWTLGNAHQYDNGEVDHLVYPLRFEEGLKNVATFTQTKLREFGIEGPWVILVSVFGAKGYRMILGDGYPTDRVFRDEALLGEQVVERIDDAALLPIAENFWLLFGVRRLAGRGLAAR